MARLVSSTDSILRESMPEVKEDTDVRPIVRGLNQILLNNKNSVGIAAPQIGVRARIIIIRTPNLRRVMLNPKIVSYGEDFFFSVEGCLSFPKKFVTLKRRREIQVTYRTLKWELKTLRVTNFLAAVIQHEIDHLNGICKVGVQI